MKKIIPAVYTIINIDSHPEPVAYAERLFRAGAELVQLRNKAFSGDRFLEIAAAIKEGRDALGRETPAGPPRLLIVNDSIEICRKVKADGVHLGQTDSPVRDAREQLGTAAIIGLSTHNREQALGAPLDMLSYLALGPIFLSSTKSGHAPIVGLDALQEISMLVTIPIVAIGGITPENADSVYRHGAHSIALISALEKSKDLPRELIHLRNLARSAASARFSGRR